VPRGKLDPVVDAELFDEELQAFVLTGQTYGMRQMLTAMVSWPGQDIIEDISTQIMFQNKINDIMLSLPKEKRTLHPFSTVSANKVLHMCCLVQKQKGQAVALLEQIYQMQGKVDPCNTHAVFEIITVFLFFISIVCFYFILFIFRISLRLLQRITLSFTASWKSSTGYSLSNMCTLKELTPTMLSLRGKAPQKRRRSEPTLD
jgi:hypothetical protein